MLIKIIPLCLGIGLGLLIFHLLKITFIESYVWKARRELKKLREQKPQTLEDIENFLQDIKIRMSSHFRKFAITILLLMTVTAIIFKIIGISPENHPEMIDYFFFSLCLLTSVEIIFSVINHLIVEKWREVLAKKQSTNVDYMILMLQYSLPHKRKKQTDA